MKINDELRSFLARLLGWNNGPAVDRALRSIEHAEAHRHLLLCGDGDLVPIAHALQRRALGADRPFVVADPRRINAPASLSFPANCVSGVAAFKAAAGGSLCMRIERPPRDVASMKELIQEPKARVQLVICAGRYDRRNVLLAVADPIQVPSLKDRAAELPRIVEEYAADAITALSSTVTFTTQDRDWVCAHSASSLQDIQRATMRILALRRAGTILNAAKLLGIGHTSLGEWFANHRRNDPRAEAEQTIGARRPEQRTTTHVSRRRVRRARRARATTVTLQPVLPSLDASGLDVAAP